MRAQEENRLKAKLRRLCDVKSGGRLQVPEWMHQKWKTGDHTAMALAYQKCGCNKDTFITDPSNRDSQTPYVMFIGCSILPFNICQLINKGADND